jgi:hypothetical protein
MSRPISGLLLALHKRQNMIRKDKAVQIFKELEREAFMPPVPE